MTTRKQRLQSPLPQAIAVEAYDNSGDQAGSEA
jgi:hypothetical protein